MTPDTADTETLLAKCAAAIDGGAAAIQYRHKDAGASLALAQARAIVALCRARGALAIVNDDAALAARVDADGVHVGEDDGDLGRVRAIVGPTRIIGVSCYDDLNRAEAAVAAGADYVAFGSFFASAVKPGARRANLAVLHRARDLSVPVVAIGGIDAGNAATLFDAGADALAVITAVFGATDIEAAARAIATQYQARAIATQCNPPHRGPSFERTP